MPRSTYSPNRSHPSDLDTKISILKEIIDYVDDELAREKHRDKKGKGGEKTPAAAAAAPYFVVPLFYEEARCGLCGSRGLGEGRIGRGGEREVGGL
jgi:hypothetical protein